MAKKQKYTVTFHLQKSDGEIVPFEKLSDEEKEEAFAGMRKNLSETLSRYFGLHPEEYEKL